MTLPNWADTTPGAWSWRPVFAYAFLWSLAVTAFETAVRADLLPQEMFQFSVEVWWGWFLSGLVIGLWTLVLAPRLGLALSLPGTLLIALVAASFNILIPSRPSAPLVSASLAYNVWQNLFYGGLLVIACVLRHRAERTRALLAEAQVARNRAEALLSQAQLQALQGQIDPSFLLRVLAEVRQRYVGDRPAADRLLDQLVGFLRLAMPGVRGGTSTLAAEVMLARSYLRLCAELEPQRAGWQVSIDEPVGEWPFPALLLPQLIDQLTVASADSPPPEPRRFTLTSCEERTTLRLHARAAAGWLSPTLHYRWQVALRTVWPEGWVLAVNDNGDPTAAAFELTLPVCAPAPVPDERASFQPTHEPGDPPWTTPVPTTI